MQRRLSKGIDWGVIIIVLIIMAFGVANIYSVDAEHGIKQLVRIGLGFGMIFFFMIITSITRNFFDIYAFIFYIVGVIALIGVLFFGREINGAKAWYSIGGVGIQPVELMKIATGLMIAHVLNIPNNSLNKPATLLTCIAIIGIPGLLILLQPDVGSLFVFGAFLLAMYREGMNPYLLLVPVILGLVFILSILWSPSLFILGFGILAWLIISLFVLLFSKSLISIPYTYSLMGVYLGLGLFFCLNLFVINVTGYDLSIKTIFSKKDELLIGITSLTMAIFSLITTLSIYLSNKTLNQSLNSFTKIKSSNSRQLISALISVIITSVIIFSISLGANKLLLKLPKHQRERIMVLFEGEAKYRYTSGYNLLYAKTAIGSGEIYGAGWNKGPITDGNFVPEQRTDYIFCTVGEEWGFIGSSLLIILYSILILRIYYLAELQKSIFARFFGYSIGSIILLHFFVNIGMVMGLFPTVGIPLPFMSYGGSSLWGFMLMLFIFLKLNYENQQSFL